MQMGTGGLKCLVLTLEILIGINPFQLDEPSQLEKMFVLKIVVIDLRRPEVQLMRFVR